MKPSANPGKGFLDAVLQGRSGGLCRSMAARPKTVFWDVFSVVPYFGSLASVVV